jgi:transcriptional regulator with XRE-family HTH domain
MSTKKKTPKFAEWLVQERNRVGLLPAHLAERANLSKQYISQLEGGQPIQPSKESVEKIAKALGVPLAIAFDAAGYKFEMEKSKTETDLLNYFRDLSQEHQTLVLRIIQTVHKVEMESEPQLSRHSSEDSSIEPL